MTDGAVVADVPGAAAHVLSDRILDRVVHVGLRDRAPLELVEQAVGRHQEPGRRVAALEGEVLEERLLERVQIAVLRREPLDRLDDLAVQVGERRGAGAQVRRRLHPL